LGTGFDEAVGFGIGVDAVGIAVVAAGAGFGAGGATRAVGVVGGSSVV